MLFHRQLQKTLSKIEGMFGAILVTGARQVGKTTLLRNAKPDIPYVTMDDPTILAAANEEPTTFLKMNPPPLVIDEIQYTPSLFPHIKMSIDSSQAKGQFFLSGSQQYQMMKNVSESLAGRIGILNLMGLSLREICGSDFDRPFLPVEGYFGDRAKHLVRLDYQAVWNIIHRGAMPAMHADPNLDWQMYYAAYTKTYIERDVRDLAHVGDELKFLKFMTAVAAATGQLLNQTSLARDVGVSVPTVERWLSILRASNLVYLLQPYHNNVTKRAIKTPKLYFMDTGLAAYLTRWNTPEVVQNGAMAGAFFETFIVAEVVKSYANAGILEPPLFFYRDKEQNEIDLVIQEGDTLHPLEIKKHADPAKRDTQAFAVLDKIHGVVRGAGGVICLYDKILPLGKSDIVVPIEYL
jgi:Predicted ATPase (AAA+ superfamily)